MSRKATTAAPTEAQIRAEQKAVEDVYRESCVNNPQLFIGGLTIPGATGPRAYASCLQPYQRAFFDAITPSLLAVRNGDTPVDRRFWLERTKKGSKDQDVASCMMWLCAFPVRPFFGQVCAANKNQAAIVKDRVTHTLFYNPWLNDYLEVMSDGIRSKLMDARIDIESTDSSGGAHGGLPDFLLLNELVHVAKWEAMVTHMNNAAGNPRGLAVIATNAGYMQTEAFKWKENFSKSPRWKTFVWDRPAPWLTKGDLEDARELNTPSEYDRLYWGKWSTGKGDALRAEDIDKIFGSGRPYKPMPRKKAGWQYIAGLDLATNRDHCGLVVLAVNVKLNVIRVARFFRWAPRKVKGKKSKEVDLTRVRRRCLKVSKWYGCRWFGYDPHQAVLMAQDLRRKGVPMRAVEFTAPKNLNAMALALMLSAKSGVLQSYDDEDGTMRRDICKFSIIKRPHGYKLVAPADEWGHADVGTALVIALPQAMAMLNRSSAALTADDILASGPDEEPMDEEELKEMPAELRDIYDTHEEMDKEQKQETDRRRARGRRQGVLG